MFRDGSFSPPGHQWITLAGLGLQTHQLSRHALETLHIMAGFTCAENTLKPLRSIEIDGEPVICASLSLCTQRSVLRSNSQEIKLDKNNDPNGVVAKFAARRNTVITADNLVRVMRPERDPE